LILILTEVISKKTSVFGFLIDNVSWVLDYIVYENLT
jgi:hypothetical protein